jgi:hypothetical protein
VTVRPPTCVAPHVDGKSRRQATEAMRAAQCGVARVTIRCRHRHKGCKHRRAHHAADSLDPRAAQSKLR